MSPLLNRWPICRPIRCGTTGRWSAVAWGVVALIATALPATAQSSRRTDDKRSERQTPVVRAVARAAPSVVNIHGEKRVRPTAAAMAGASPKSVNGMGTGVIIDPRGYIVTNYHVVQDVANIQVTMADGSSRHADLIAAKVRNDLALVKLRPRSDDEGPVPTIPRGRSHDLMVGESVIAIGNAFGYVHTTTMGIISALHRDVPVNETQEYRDLIQISTGINPGNSGGPLLNIHGEIIGINVAVRVGAQQIAFAIPIDQVIDTVADMIDQRNRSRLAIGFSTAGGTNSERRGDGVTVTHVTTRGIAAQKGLRKGDRVVRVGDRDVDSKLDLALALIDHRTTEPLDLAVVRAGRRYRVALGTPGRETKQRVASTWTTLGMKARPIAREQLAQLGRQFAIYNGGLAITEVRPDSPAGRSGLNRGDILVAVHGFETLQLSDLPMILREPMVSDRPEAEIMVIHHKELWSSRLDVAAVAGGATIR